MARQNEYESFREESLRRTTQKATENIVQPDAIPEEGINYIYMNPAQKAVYNYRYRVTCFRQ